MKSLLEKSSFLMLFIILFLCMSGSVTATPSYNIPSIIDTSAKYLFFLHGTITENKGAYGSHPRYGTYDYHKMVKAFADRGFTVISEIRSKGTVKVEYAKKVVQQIQTLLASGVSPKNIIVAGFSKGGSITLYVSTILKNPKVKFVVMAGCGRTGMYKRGYKQFLREAAPSLQGHFLSLYDEKDSICGTCKKAFEAASGEITNREIELKVGKGHGTFYKPRKEWFEPVVEWMNR